MSTTNELGKREPESFQRKTKKEEEDMNIKNPGSTHKDDADSLDKKVETTGLENRNGNSSEKKVLISDALTKRDDADKNKDYRDQETKDAKKENKPKKW